jgi:predicted dehydrogenase
VTAVGAPPLRIGIVGCGNICGPYARDIVTKPELRLTAFTDLDPTRAEQMAREHGGRAVPTVDDLIAESDLVVNLTFQQQHAPVTRQALEAGRHVHSEKPLAMTPAEAHALVQLARARGVRLGVSPFTLMGEAQQTTWKLLRDGRIGPVRAVLADVSWGRIETWHPAPLPFYEVGPLVDVGVYPLTLITAMLGPVRKVQAFGRILLPKRRTRDGAEFTVETPDFIVCGLELEGGVAVRLTASFYTGHQARREAAVEFHGDDGSIDLERFDAFDARVEVAGFDAKDSYAAVPLVRPAAAKFDWARAVEDMAQAIADDRPHRATGEQAAHVVDVFAAVVEAVSTGRTVAVTSTFPSPPPMPWAA